MAKLTERRALWGTLALGLAILLVLLVVDRYHPNTLPRLQQKNPRPLAPATVPLPNKLTLPTLTSVQVLDMSPERARELNRTIPFSDKFNTPAEKFRYAGSPVDREIAATCLTSAVLYEAGDDPIGQQAVAQVVLNRLRHPAFPKTICGVVFQGSERKTGCQFTFTCDGSFARIPSPASWKRARLVADRAIGGFVLKAVGTATHYHTDWVVPYWANSLDKVSKVHTHIFYRWRGWWGTPPAFSRQYQPGEVLDGRLMPFVGPATAASPGLLSLQKAEVKLTGADDLNASSMAPLAAPQNTRALLSDSASGTFIMQLDPEAYPGSYAIFALHLCRNSDPCLALGWSNLKNIPSSLPLRPAQMISAAFVYRKKREVDSAQWNCQVFRRPDPAQCRPGTE